MEGVSPLGGICVFSHLCTESKAVAVRVSSGCVVEHAGTVHALQEALRDGLVLGDHALRVTRPVLFDVLHRGVSTLDYLERNRKVPLRPHLAQARSRGTEAMSEKDSEAKGRKTRISRIIRKTRRKNDETYA